MSADPVFGRRGARPSPREPIAPRPSAEEDALSSAYLPSAAYLKIAEAAHAAFHGEAAAVETLGPAEPGPALATGEAAMRAYIGPHWPSYSELWRVMEKAPRLRASRPFSAATLTGVWLIYRKQYVMGVALLALEGLLASYDLSYGMFVHLAAAAFLGRFGRSIVLLSGFSAIANAEGLGGGASARLDAVRAAGGTNLAFAALAFSVASVLVAVTLRAAPPEPNAAGLLKNVLDALP